MLHALSTFVFLYAFWLLLSGYFTAFLLAAGAGSALAVLLFSRRIGINDHEGHPVHLAWRAPISYWPWLCKEIVKSAWDVTRMILASAIADQPDARPLQAAPSRPIVGLVIHANSITLTPGTITVEVGRGEFLVHALTAAGAAGSLAGSEMDRRVTAWKAGGDVRRRRLARCSSPSRSRWRGPRSARRSSIGCRPPTPSAPARCCCWR